MQLFAIELPGHGRRLDEDPVDQLDIIVSAVLAAVAEKGFEQFAYFGHSMGGLLAFELAHAALVSQGPIPDLLLISGCPAPEQVKADEIRDLDEDGLIQKLRDLQGTPGEILESPALLKLFLPGIRADFTIFADYIAPKRAPAPIPLMTYGGSADEFASRGEMVGWSAATSRAHQHTETPGGHFFLKEDEPRFLRLVSSALEAHLLLREAPAA